jgi:hypothetical protein
MVGRCNTGGVDRAQYLRPAFFSIFGQYSANLLMRLIVIASTSVL